jgi:hypothetical protein
MIDGLDAQHALHGAERPLGPPHVPVAEHQLLGGQIHFVRHQDVLAVEAFVLPHPVPVDLEASRVGFPQVAGVASARQQPAGLPGVTLCSVGALEFLFQAGHDLPAYGPVLGRPLRVPAHHAPVPDEEEPAGTKTQQIVHHPLHGGHVHRVAGKDPMPDRQPVPVDRQTEDHPGRVAPPLLRLA